MKVSNTSERLKQLMKERNIKQVDIIRLCEPYCKDFDMKMGKSDISQYVSGKTTPNNDKLYILAKALNVTESWLMGMDTNSLNHKDEKDIAKKLDETLQALNNTDGLMFDGEILDENTAELIKSSIENALTTGKLLAKQKYTPKKYRNENEE